MFCILTRGNIFDLMFNVFTVCYWYTQIFISSLWTMNRHGKSGKHTSIAYVNIFRKLWTFLVKQQIYLSMATSLHFLSTINLFSLKKLNVLEKIAIQVTEESFEFANIFQSWIFACEQNSSFSLSDHELCHASIDWTLFPS